MRGRETRTCDCNQRICKSLHSKLSQLYKQDDVSRIPWGRKDIMLITSVSNPKNNKYYKNKNKKNKKNNTKNKKKTKDDKAGEKPSQQVYERIAKALGVKDEGKGKKEIKIGIWHYEPYIIKLYLNDLDGGKAKKITQYLINDSDCSLRKKYCPETNRYDCLKTCAKDDRCARAGWCDCKKYINVPKRDVSHIEERLVLQQEQQQVQQPSQEQQEQQECHQDEEVGANGVLEGPEVMDTDTLPPRSDEDDRVANEKVDLLSLGNKNSEMTPPCDREAEGSSLGINDGVGDNDMDMDVDGEGSVGDDMDIDAGGEGREDKDDVENSNKISTPLQIQSWPQIDHRNEEGSHNNRRYSSGNSVQPLGRRDNPVTQMASTIDPCPATTVADSSSPNTMTLLASHSASAFPKAADVPMDDANVNNNSENKPPSSSTITEDILPAAAADIDRTQSITMVASSNNSPSRAARNVSIVEGGGVSGTATAESNSSPSSTVVGGKDGPTAIPAAECDPAVVSSRRQQQQAILDVSAASSVNNNNTDGANDGGVEEEDGVTENDGEECYYNDATDEEDDNEIECSRTYEDEDETHSSEFLIPTDRFDNSTREGGVAAASEVNNSHVNSTCRTNSLMSSEGGGGPSSSSSSPPTTTTTTTTTTTKNNASSDYAAKKSEATAGPDVAVREKENKDEEMTVEDEKEAAKSSPTASDVKVSETPAAAVPSPQVDDSNEVADSKPAALSNNSDIKPTPPSNSSIRRKGVSWEDLETKQVGRKERRNNFDGDDRSQVGVIKSALRSRKYSNGDIKPAAAPVARPVANVAASKPPPTQPQPTPPAAFNPARKEPKKKDLSQMRPTKLLGRKIRYKNGCMGRIIVIKHGGHLNTDNVSIDTARTTDAILVEEEEKDDDDDDDNDVTKIGTKVKINLSDYNGKEGEIIRRWRSNEVWYFVVNDETVRRALTMDFFDVVGDSPSSTMGDTGLEEQKEDAYTASKEMEMEGEGDDEISSVTYTRYKPQKVTFGEDHPDPVVENSTLSAVEPPNVEYRLKMSADTWSSRQLSNLQLEAIIYGCQRHRIYLPLGEDKNQTAVKKKPYRAGFLLGDGAGMGKVSYYY